MNEIKFKIWDRKKRRMYTWIDDEPQEELIEEFEESVDIMGLSFYKYTDKEYLLYSGLKDKHNKEYCVGDIVKVKKLTFESSATLPENLVVRYYGGMFQLFRGNECLMGLHLSYIEDGEIIGNIYENFDLLES
jgi:hypothetical protein